MEASFHWTRSCRLTARIARGSGSAFRAGSASSLFRVAILCLKTSLRATHALPIFDRTRRIGVHLTEWSTARHAEAHETRAAADAGPGGVGNWKEKQRGCLAR